MLMFSPGAGELFHACQDGSSQCPRDPGLMVPVTIFFIAGSSGSSVCIGDVGVPTWFCCSLFALGRRGEFVGVHTLIYSDARKCFETRHTTKSSLVRMRCGHGGEQPFKSS